MFTSYFAQSAKTFGSAVFKALMTKLIFSTPSGEIFFACTVTQIEA